MIRGTACIGVVFFDLQTGLIIERPVENMRCLSGCRCNDLGVLRTELVA